MYNICQVLIGARMPTLLAGVSRYVMTPIWSLDCVICLPEPVPLQLVSSAYWRTPAGHCLQTRELPRQWLLGRQGQTLKPDGVVVSCMGEHAVAGAPAASRRDAKHILVG